MFMRLKEVMIMIAEIVSLVFFLLSMMYRENWAHNSYTRFLESNSTNGVNITTKKSLF